MFGYFPAYLIGAVIAAQLFETFNRAVEPGDGEGGTSLSRLGDWLSEHVWSRGAAKTTEALVREVTGAPISPDALRAHFQRRYGIT
jgi:carboxypeptidase Taq